MVAITLTVGDNSYIGTSGDDIIQGNTGSDTLFGGEGNDQLYSYAYFHYTFYDSDYDELHGGGGNDSLQGDIGYDYLDGGTGNDWLSGEDGNDDLYGGDGNDVVYGGAGSDYMQGDAGNDYLSGGAGDDMLDAGTGVDTLAGGSGNDDYYVDGPADKVDEFDGGGIDWIHSSASRTLDANVENLDLFSGAANGTGNDLDNEIDGNYANNALSGLAGNDTLYGFSGNDTLDAGTGVDALYGGDGNDSYYVDGSADRIIEYAGEGMDRIYASATRTLDANVEDLILTGGAAINGTGNDLGNGISGNSGDNALSGLGGNDVLFGGAGADTMTGGTGNDTYYVDTALDRVVETTAGAAGGTDTVNTSLSYTLGTNVEILRLAGTASVSGVGNGLGNTLVGNAAANNLRGLAGIDVIEGGRGADVLTGGTGGDIFVFTEAAASTQAARDRLVAGDGAIAFEGAGAAAGDRIDLSKIDANSAVAGQQHFVFGTSTGIGHIWLVTSGTDTLIRGNTDTDSAVEFELAIADGATGHTAYSAADFIL